MPMAICSIPVCTGDQLCTVRQCGIEAGEHTGHTIHPNLPGSSWELGVSRFLTATIPVTVPSHLQPLERLCPKAEKKSKKRSICEYYSKLEYHAVGSLSSLCRLDLSLDVDI